MLELYSPRENIAKYNEILNQPAREKLNIHLWNYTKSIYSLCSNALYWGLFDQPTNSLRQNSWSFLKRGTNQTQ
jgi:hypothetical protein